VKLDLVVHNIGQLVTCRSDGKPKRRAAMCDVGIIEDAAIAIADGKVVGVGRSGEILSEYSFDSDIDAGGKVVCPGFVDPHTHIVYAGDRLDEFELKIKGADYLEILEKGGGIVSTVRKTREATFAELVEQSRHRLDRMLACGTTTAEIKTGYGLDVQTELKMLDVVAELDKTHSINIVPTFLGAHAVPPEFKNNPGGYVDLICNEMLPAAWRWFTSSRFYGRVPFFADVFCEKNAFNLEQSRRILETARSLGFKLKAHVDQFNNLGGSRMAIEAGATSVDHLDAISDAEVELLARNNAVGVIIPTENFSAGKTQFADAREMIDSGCAIAISTDYNPGSAPCPSQPMAMAIACRYQRMLPSEALNAATINAAHAVRLGAEIGSIEAGMHADLLIFGTSDYREIVYEFGDNHPSAIIKDGKLIGR
jgi:imidazolonepropionase